MNHVIPLPCDFQLVANSRSFFKFKSRRRDFYITREKDIFFLYRQDRTVRDEN